MTIPSKENASPERSSRDLRWYAAGVLWLSVVVVGLGWVSKYKNTPGIEAIAPTRWPTSRKLKPSGTRPTLVLLAHPRCTCTRATLTELARLMTQLEGRVEAYVLVVVPSGDLSTWSETENWREAARIPGVTVIADEGGAEAAIFGASTSGQTLLFGPDGALVFRGGITLARGHEGDNAGSNQILAFVTGRATDLVATPVFGCGLFDPGEERRSEGSSNTQ